MNWMLLTLAWRNIWRNKRRAIITISSIIVSLFFVLLLRQMQLWTYDFNTKNTISGYVGYIQITDSTFVNEEILDNSITASHIPSEAIKKIEGVSGLFPRIQSGALISTGIKSKFAGVIGIQPSIDNKELKISKKLSEGELLNDDDKSIIITDKMAKYYRVKVGDSLVLIGQGYQGFTASGIYPIKGIVNFPAGDMANMVFMPLKEAQYFYAAPERYTSFLINLNESNDLKTVLVEVKKVVTDKTLTIRTWEEVLPGLKQGLELDSNSGKLIAAILYMIVGFGIFGTIVMLYNERTFEFGVLSAIGMHRKKIILATIIELQLLTLIGVVLGNIVAFPILYYYNQHPYELSGETAQGMADQGFEPFIGTGIYPDVFINNSLIVLLISAFVSMYIVFKIINLNALTAMKQH